MLKKIFRSSYEDVTDTNGVYQRQTVNEVKAVIVPSLEERWEVIGEMNKQNFHQVIAVHDIQADFIRSALKYGAELTDMVLRGVEKPEEHIGEEIEEKPVKSFLSRFLGAGENAEEMKESRARILEEKQKRYVQYEVMQSDIRNRLDWINQKPDDLLRLYEELGNNYVDIVKLRMDNTLFTLESNGFFYYPQGEAGGDKLELLLIEECETYFN